MQGRAGYFEIQNNPKWLILSLMIVVKVCKMTLNTQFGHIDKHHSGLGMMDDKSLSQLKMYNVFLSSMICNIPGN